MAALRPLLGVLSGRGLVSMKILGIGSLNRKFKGAKSKLRKESERRALLAAEAFVAQTQRTIRGSRTRAKRQGEVVTAPPGILGIDSGKGRASIKIYKRKRQGRLTRVDVSSPLDYMTIQERKGDYKWLEPAFDKAAKKMGQILGRIPEKVI